MGSVRDDEGAPVRSAPASPAAGDRRAEALRANLKRRKVQARARVEDRPGDRPAPASERDV